MLRQKANNGCSRVPGAESESGTSCRTYSASKVIHQWRGAPGYAPQSTVNNFARVIIFASLISPVLAQSFGWARRARMTNTALKRVDVFLEMLAPGSASCCKEILRTFRSQELLLRA